MADARRPKERWLPWLQALGWGASAALCGCALAVTLEVLLLALEQRGAGLTLWGLALAWIALAPLGLPPALLLGALGGLLWRALSHSVTAPGLATNEPQSLAKRAQAGGPLLTATGALLLGVGAASELRAAQALGLVLLAASVWWVCMVALRLDQPASSAPPWRLGARWAVARFATLWVALGACGVEFAAWTWGNPPEEGALPLRRGAMAGLAVEALQKLVDQDGDQRSPLWGGGDCDDHAPSTFVGASDPSGDGVDQDCDGRDSSPRASLPPAPPDPPDVGLPGEELDFTLEEATPHAALDAGQGDLGESPVDADAPTPSEARPGLERWVGRPIILVTIDTLRPDFLGLAGAQPSPSPQLDALARESWWFSEAWSQGPLTKASVSSMMTGRYFSELHRTRDAWTRLLDENETLAERLVRLGYTTAAVTSHPYLDDPYGHAQGFERFTTTPNPDRLWHADEVTQRGVALLDKLRGDGRPYFLWLHYLDPHHPYAPHPSGGRLAPDGAPWGEAPQRRYQAEIAWTDRHLGAFLDHARASGALDEALLVVHSDHGEGFREHGYEYHGQSLYEDQIRVLLLARAPGLPAARVEAPTMLLDLFPTLLHLASGQAPSEPPLGRGRSLAPLMAGAPPDLERPIFSEMRSDTRRSDLKALRQGRWKLIHDLRADRWEWFDLLNDPREAKPLPPSRDPATFERLQGLLRRFEAESVRTIPAR